jgi:membrane-associated phospholipid phosphatase
MQPLLQVIRKHVVYFSGFSLAMIAAIIYVSIDSKLDGFFRLNGLHKHWLDTAFTGITFLGDGLFSLLVVVLLLFGRRFRLAMQVLAAFLLSGIAAQVLKFLFHAPRPMAVIAPADYPYFITGVTHAGLNSFPSGHATSMFALATVLALSFAKKTPQIIFLLMALLVGYSRIYLGQHFPEDIIAGASLGTLTGTLVHCFMNSWKRFFRRRSIPSYTGENSYSSFAGN